MYRLITLLFLLLSQPLHAQQIEVRGAHVLTAPGQTRLVVDTAASVSHKIFPLQNPHRLVIDIPDARLKSKLPTIEGDEPLLLGLRSGIREGDDLRLVLDLKQKVRAKSFMLQPNGEHGHRLVVDLVAAGKSLPTGEFKGGKAHPPSATRLRDLVVAIDAGHGGADPGAIGAKGTREKVVTLQIARKLARLMKNERGLRPVLIRDGDYFIHLRKRISLARKNKADLFVSIHADAYRDRRVGGSSVYTLSQNGASSEAAKWLADKENRADLIGGVDASEADALGKILSDLMLSATLEHSNLAAGKVLTNLKKVGAMHKGRVQKAGFVVLKSPDIPSLLVETAFISNPKEEQRLRSSDHQAKLARAILAGIKSYFAGYAPPGTRFARGATKGQRYVIGRGDTLGEIAEQHHVSVSSLRSLNNIEGDRIRVGQVLTIPES